MLRCAICDDEKNFREELKQYLCEFAKLNQMELQIQEYESGNKLTEADFRADILFLDIDMEGKNGLETGQEIWQKKKELRIIYVTNLGDMLSRRTAQNKIHAFAYLEKPVCREELFGQLEDICTELRENEQENRVLSFKVIGKGTMAFDINEICYFEYKSGKVQLVLDQDGESVSYYIQDSLSGIDVRTNPYGFMRPHKGFVVNVRSVKRIYQYTVYMTNNDRIPLSQKRAVEFRKYWYKLLDEEGLGR